MSTTTASLLLLLIIKHECLRYMAEILPIRSKTLSNQSIRHEWPSFAQNQLNSRGNAWAYWIMTNDFFLLLVRCFYFRDNNAIYVLKKSSFYVEISRKFDRDRVCGSGRDPISIIWQLDCPTVPIGIMNMIEFLLGFFFQINGGKIEIHTVQWFKQHKPFLNIFFKFYAKVSDYRTCGPLIRIRSGRQKVSLVAWSVPCLFFCS